jgi:hypothetical protein
VLRLTRVHFVAPTTRQCHSATISHIGAERARADRRARAFSLALLSLCELALGGAGCAGSSSGQTCAGTIGTNQLPIPAASRLVQFLPDGRVVGIANETLQQLPVSTSTGLPIRQSSHVRDAVAKLRNALAGGLSDNPGGTVQEVWRADGAAVIARSSRVSAYAMIEHGSVRLANIQGTGCWNIADPQFDRFGRAVARAELAGD